MGSLPRRRGLMVGRQENRGLMLAFWAQLLCLRRLSPTDSSAQDSVGTDPDGRLFCIDGLVVYVRHGLWASSKRNLAAVPESCLGPIRKRFPPG